eukprot:CAMPEP_0178968892 /NCGR_PEP_ID=MMETSP0789-20121207/18524_1 /TAXON_ID=3005 /ORGANISM="Rhizosolenia setigera, Strain CCMP 1694" /LENGTH=132 /DNA_ID=CAMNT_0020654907 /DNA_START=46 /DNA_END=444 /DNA_ORIENTATION=-
MRIIDVTYPFLVLFVIYLYQKVQHHDTVIAKIDKNLDVESHWQRETSESEILNIESDYKKDEDPHQATMKENLVHHVHNETKRDKSMNQNRSVSRKASDRNYDKYRYCRDVFMIPTHGYRKSFDALNNTGII